MNDSPAAPPETQPMSPRPGPDEPQAQVHLRRPFHFIWLVPVVAGLIAAYLAYRSLSDRGPSISISFNSADGLVAGQTKLRHKAVDLGTVHAIVLAKDMTHVEVQADMHGNAARYLTDNARFWVVRPRLTAGNITGLDTLLSGSYIEMDPGQPSGAQQLTFTGLEEPPAVRSDEPGRSFVLTADRIGSLSSGSPLFYHDIVAGEVLGYDVRFNDNSGTPAIALHVFIRAPYDQLVHPGSHFWNASGVSVDLGAQGVRLRVESLQAVLSGGVAFDSPDAMLQTEPSPTNAAFQLYNDQQAAASAGYRERIKFLSYFTGSVRGLAVGAPVELFGIQIGNVTDVRLEFDPAGRNSRVVVRMEVQPERILETTQLRRDKPLDVSRTLVKRGLRVQLRSASLLTGQLVVALDFFPSAPDAQVLEDNGVIVLPSLPGGLDSITASASSVMSKLDALPLDEIGRSLNETMAGLRAVATGPELRQSLQALSSTLLAVQDLTRKTDAEVGPALKRLPEIAAGLQAAVDRAGKLLGSADVGYGEGSQFRRDLERLLQQVSDTARSVRLLADYLDQHPEALLRGRTGRAGER